MVFDVVLANRSLAEMALHFHPRYERPFGPAVPFTGLRTADVLTPDSQQLSLHKAVPPVTWSCLRTSKRTR